MYEKKPMKISNICSETMYRDSSIVKRDLLMKRELQTKKIFGKGSTKETLKKDAHVEKKYTRDLQKRPTFKKRPTQQTCKRDQQRVGNKV